jgi:hypothetical protein
MQSIFQKNAAGLILFWVILSISSCRSIERSEVPEIEQDEPVDEQIQPEEPEDSAEKTEWLSREICGISSGDFAKLAEENVWQLRNESEASLLGVDPKNAEILYLKYSFDDSQNSGTQEFTLFAGGIMMAADTFSFPDVSSINLLRQGQNIGFQCSIENNELILVEQSTGNTLSYQPISKEQFKNEIGLSDDF